MPADIKRPDHSKTKPNQPDLPHKQSPLEDLTLEGFLPARQDVSHFMLTRYPYLCAVLLLVSVPEEVDKLKRNVPNIQIIFLQLCLYFFSGTIMSFDMFGLKRVFTYVFMGQLAVQLCQEFDSKYNEVIIVRLVCRNLACIGSYIAFAGGVGKSKPSGHRNDKLIKIGRQLIGTYLLLMAIFLYISEVEFSNHSKSFHVMGYFGTWILIVCYALCGFCLDYGVAIALTSHITVFLLMLVTFTVDMDTDMWLNSGSIKTWKTATIACRHIPVIGILVLLSRDSGQS